MENFKYTLVLDGVNISLMDINGTIVAPIEASGKITVDRALPFIIEIRADLNSPTGSGTFQLKDLEQDKNVFAEPVPLEFDATGRGGLLLPNVKLP